MSTTRKYAKKPKETQKGETPYNEIRITGTDYVGKYITYAASLLVEGREVDGGNKEKVDKIVLKATGVATKVACLVAEILKHRIYGLHQLNTIETITVFDEYEPLEEGLDHIKIERKLAVFEIQLSTKDGVLDTKAPGYQPPLPKNEVQEEDLGELLKRRREGGGDRRGGGRGRGDRRGGRRGGRTGGRGGRGRRGGRGGRGSDRQEGGERRNYDDRREGGERRDYDDRRGGERRDYNERRGGERRDYGDRTEGGERRDYGDRREGGERREYNNRRGGERRDYNNRRGGERRDYNNRRGGERRGRRGGDGDRGAPRTRGGDRREDHP